MNISCINRRLQLKRGLFWTDIIQNCTKWSITGLHGLSYTSFDAKLRCASFLPQKNQEKSQYDPKKHKNADFHEKKSLRSYMPNTKVGKKTSSNKIHSKLIDLIIYNQF